VYVVDANIDVRFGVVATTKEEAEDQAKQLVKKLFETGVLGAGGYNLDIKQIKEAKIEA